MYELTDFDITWRMMENRRVYCTWDGLWNNTENCQLMILIVFMMIIDKDKARLN